jgi:hypothetical protein
VSLIVERVSDDVRRSALARFDFKPATTPHVVAAHEEARQRSKMLADWAMQTLPPGDDLKAALDAIFAACVALNTAIAQTQLMGEIERMLAAKRKEEIAQKNADGQVCVIYDPTPEPADEQAP